MVNELFQWSSCSGWICLASHERAEGGQINFFTHTGEKSEQSVLTRSVRVTVIAWHPSEAVVALGWEDGYVTLISPSRELGVAIII
uniref:ANAPC4_WD40 domain-containing protein n=1 Tax=Heterorhabditis bacteriophora TaxID=37862 RepID=A0A1I7W7I6_HETBA